MHHSSVYIIITNVVNVSTDYLLTLIFIWQGAAIIYVKGPWICRIVNAIGLLLFIRRGYFFVFANSKKNTVKIIILRGSA